MDREQVLAATDDELQKEVAILLGATEVTHSVVSGVLVGYWPEGDEGHGEGLQPIEDYSNDWAAAGELWAVLVEQGYEPSLSSSLGLHEVSLIVPGTDHLDLCSASSNIVPRAITRAFVMALGAQED